MSYEQVRSALDRIQFLHEAAADLYRRLQPRAEGTRLEMLLEFLENHERRLADGLGQYAMTAPESFLSTWYQFTPGHHPLTQFKRLEAHDNLTSEEVLDLALWFDGWIANFYRTLRDTAPTPSLRDTFQSILTAQRGEGQLIARQAFAQNDF